MATFVLLHGGWGGGWEWRTVADDLLAHGHRVFSPSLTGLGDRQHLATKKTGLNTHVEDVVALIDSERLDEVLVVGHSYSGMVITAAADRIANSARCLVYVDAFLPEAGECLFDLIPSPLVDHLTDLCTRKGDGWKVPIPFEVPADAPRDIADYLSRASVPMPLRCFTQPVTAGAAAEVRSLFIKCTDVPPDEDFLIGSSNRAKKLGWEHRDIEAPHDAPYLAPRVLTAELLDLARRLGAA